MKSFNYNHESERQSMKEDNQPLKNINSTSRFNIEKDSEEYYTVLNDEEMKQLSDFKFDPPQDLPR